MYSRSGIAAATGDFDNDGKLDFILAAQQPVNFVHPPLDVYFVSNSGGGKYASPRVVAQLPMRAQSGAALATGDFDNDGKLDFLVAAQQPGSIDHMPATVYVFMNQGNAVFSKR